MLVNALAAWRTKRLDKIVNGERIVTNGKGYVKIFCNL